MRSALLTASAALAAVAAPLAAAVPAEWDIQMLCRSSLNPSVNAFNLPNFSSMSGQYLALDEDGSVAIRVILPNQEGLFFGKDGTGGLIATVDSTFDPVWSTSIDLRNARIGVSKIFGDDVVLFDTAGNTLQTFGPGGPQGLSSLAGPSLASDGSICYRGDFGSFDKIVIDRFNGAVREQILVADNFTGAYSFLFSNPRLNDAGQAAFQAIPTSGPSRRILRRNADGSFTTMMQTGARWNATVNSFGFGQDGGVAFTARRASDSIWEIVRTNDGLAYTTIAVGGQLGIQNSDLVNWPVSTNASGWVAFRAKDATNSQGLFVGDGDSLVKIVGAGDPLPTDTGPVPAGLNFGGTTGVATINAIVDINDAGQIAFSAFLSDDSVGLFLATPRAACAADLNGDGIADFGDVSAFADAFTAQAPLADINADSVIDFGDVAAFVDAFNAGC
jgi:hypothetical protein